MILNKFFDFLFPPKCILCGKLIKGNTDYFCCSACEEEYLFKLICCSKCSGALDGGTKPLCYTCRAAKRYFDGAISASRYSGSIRKAILRFKFKPEPYMAKTLARFIIYAFKKSGADAGSFDLVVSVPTDKKRRRSRGFDHTALLGKAISENLSITFCNNAVLKIRDNLPQHLLNSRQRIDNVRGAYKIIKPDDVSGKNILLIDDVFTTGSTVSEVSKVLKRAGANYVLVATVAKSVPKI